MGHATYGGTAAANQRYPTRGSAITCGRRVDYLVEFGSAYPRDGLQHGIAVASEMRTLLSGGELFQRDQLLFQ